jgi:hypothetical protein
MNNFIKSLFLFVLVGTLIGELIVRAFSLNADIPKSYMGKDHLIKNYPNQTGNYVNGTHKWIVNKYGNFGYESKSLDSMVTIIGDSYISNLMNPPECHQAKYLSNMVSKFNFYPSSRDGASFIEMMERAKALEYLHPRYQLLYVHHGDFIESIHEIKKIPLTVQYSLNSKKITYAKLQSNILKDVLYNFKFFYYIYRNFLVSNKDVSSNNRDEIKKEKIDYNLIEKLIIATKQHYDIRNIILVFSPDTDLMVVDLAHRNGFQYFLLKTSNYKSWQLPNNSHWSCFGHEEAAKQVSSELLKMK